MLQKSRAAAPKMTTNDTQAAPTCNCAGVSSGGKFGRSIRQHGVKIVQLVKNLSRRAGRRKLRVADRPTGPVQLVKSPK